MEMPAFARKILLAVQAVIALTSVLGGAALIVGATVGENVFVQGLSADYLVGSPFTSYLVPGIVLAVVVGGIHLAAFVMLKRRTRGSVFASAVAGFGLLIWIFVQMVGLPFTVLQAVYFAAGLAEIGLVLLMLGLFTDDDAPEA
jgi:hypothetical protein